MNHLSSTLLGAARKAAYVGYFLLCARFLVVTERAGDAPIVFSLLVGGAAVVAAWNPWASVEAFMLLFPLLFGLGRLGIMTFASPEMIVFASLSMSLMGRRLIMWRPWRRAPDLRAAPLSAWEPRVVALADLLAAWTLLSFLRWLLGGNGGKLHFQALWNQGTFGFSDPLFPVTDTLIWLMGWFFLRLLLLGEGSGIQRVSDGEAATPASKGDGPTEGCLGFSMLSWAACTLVFFGLQAVLGLPEGFGYVGNFGAPTSMFSDPHSLGSVSSALAVGLLGARVMRPGPGRVGAVLLAAVLLALVALCYSRAAWLASAIALGLLLYSWRRSLAVAFAAAAFLLLGLVAWKADVFLRLDHRYVTRLVYLVRPDLLGQGHDARLEIYRRAPAMIAAHPLLGHGPGSSRVASAGFLGSGDQWGPDFMHDTVLQTAVEQGIPAGILYSGLLLAPLAFALAQWRKVSRDPMARGACYAMVAYLITQLSSNSLNVYVDQQFFYWSLTAILLYRLRVVWEHPGAIGAPGEAYLPGYTRRH